MDTSEEQAKYYLEQIQAVSEQTKKRIAAGSTAPQLILWGAIWFIAYIVTYLSYLFGFDTYSYSARLTDRINIGINIAGLCWLVLIPIGITASWILAVRKSPTKSAHDRRWGFCWLILFVYGGIWLALLRPSNEYQTSAFFASLAMFAYVVTGFWVDRVLLWLGVVVTLVILFCFYLFL
ncbi:MAG: hypothetical protein ACYS4W_04720, partial [Planctomycetota bacterium]